MKLATLDNCFAIYSDYEWNKIYNFLINYNYEVGDPWTRQFETGQDAISDIEVEDIEEIEFNIIMKRLFKNNVHGNIYGDFPDLLKFIEEIKDDDEDTEFE